MNGEIAVWNNGLLFAALCAILGVAGVVSAERSSDRRLASGMFLQGIILVFVAGGAYFHGVVDLRLGGLTIAGLLIVQSLVGPGPDTDDQPLEKNDSE